MVFINVFWNKYFHFFYKRSYKSFGSGISFNISNLNSQTYDYVYKPFLKKGNLYQNRIGQFFFDNISWIHYKFKWLIYPTSTYKRFDSFRSIQQHNDKRFYFASLFKFYQINFFRYQQSSNFNKWRLIQSRNFYINLFFTKQKRLKNLTYLKTFLEYNKNYSSKVFFFLPFVNIYDISLFQQVTDSRRFSSLYMNKKSKTWYLKKYMNFLGPLLSKNDVSSLMGFFAPIEYRNQIFLSNLKKDAIRFSIFFPKRNYNTFQSSPQISSSFSLDQNISWNHDYDINKNKIIRKKNGFNNHLKTFPGFSHSIPLKKSYLRADGWLKFNIALSYTTQSNLLKKKKSFQNNLGLSGIGRLPVLFRSYFIMLFYKNKMQDFKNLKFNFLKLQIMCFNSYKISSKKSYQSFFWSNFLFNNKNRYNFIINKISRKNINYNSIVYHPFLGSYISAYKLNHNIFSFNGQFKPFFSYNKFNNFILFSNKFNNKKKSFFYSLLNFDLFFIRYSFWILLLKSTFLFNMDISKFYYFFDHLSYKYNKNNNNILSKFMIFWTKKQNFDSINFYNFDFFNFFSNEQSLNIKKFFLIFFKYFYSSNSFFQDSFKNFSYGFINNIHQNKLNIKNKINIKGLDNNFFKELHGEINYNLDLEKKNKKENFLIKISNIFFNIINGKKHNKKENDNIYLNTNLSNVNRFDIVNYDDFINNNSYVDDNYENNLKKFINNFSKKLNNEKINILNNNSLLIYESEYNSRDNVQFLQQHKIYNKVDECLQKVDYLVSSFFIDSHKKYYNKGYIMTEQEMKKIDINVIKNIDLINNESFYENIDILISPLIVDISCLFILNALSPIIQDTFYFNSDEENAIRSSFLLQFNNISYKFESFLIKQMENLSANMQMGNFSKEDIISYSLYYRLLKDLINIRYYRDNTNEDPFLGLSLETLISFKMPETSTNLESFLISFGFLANEIVSEKDPEVYNLFLSEFNNMRYNIANSVSNIINLDKNSKALNNNVSFSLENINLLSFENSYYKFLDVNFLKKLYLKELDDIQKNQEYLGLINDIEQEKKKKMKSILEN